MDFNKILAFLETEEFEGGASRQKFFNKAGNGLKAALLSLPAAMMFIPRQARAQSTPGITGSLNFALTLEYLEDEFYKKALAASGLIPPADRNIFTQISKHETAHVSFLKTALGSAAANKPAFDFTAQGLIPNVFSDYPTFLTLAQALEDGGVRAYKGQVSNLITDPASLKSALQIHSVEARHAAEVRRLRGSVTGQAIKGWITGDESNGAPQSVYAGEDDTTQGSDLADLLGLSTISTNAMTEAYDEPLGQDEIMAIVQPFMAI